MSLMPLMLADMLCAPHSLVKTANEALPSVQETADGWLIRTSLPGLTAKDVTVEVSKNTSVDAGDTGDSHHLWLHALPRFKTELRLPRNADMQRVSASLVHGVLTVAVPKAPAVDVPVTVETTALPDDLPEPRGQVSLALPGLGAADLQVTITRDRSLMLHVKGSNKVFGSLHEVLRLPERSVATQARASMVNGLFSFSVPIAAEHVQTITVSAEQAPEPMDADGAPNKEAEHKALLLLEAAVPGLQASDFTSEVRGRTLTVHSAKAPAHSKRPLRRAVLLPPHTRVEDVRATCLNGLLKVTAEIHKPERSSVPVSDAEVAALTAAPAPATPAAPDAAIEDANAAAAAA